MMMMGTHFMKEVPFHDVYIHALVLDEKGQKMSKTKGNVMDPLGHRHLLPLLVEHEGMDVDVVERHLLHKVGAHQHHPRDPEGMMSRLVISVLVG